MMKRMKKVGVCVALIGVLAALSACGKAEPKTAEEVTTLLEEKGFWVEDCTEQFADYDYVEKSIVALSPDEGYQVEFYELDGEEGASTFYKINYTLLSEGEEGASSHTESSTKNQQKYQLTTKDKFGGISRIMDTCFYFNVDKEYKDEVKKIKDELGY